MSALRFYIFLIALGLSFTSANSQNLKFKQFTTGDGLISDEIYDLYQDKKGYLWAFTNCGAMKYNSKEFKHVLKNLPFKDSFIYSIYENESGEKWVANSNAKIYKLRNDSAFLVKGTEKVSEYLRKNISEIYQLHVDDSLNIYAITKDYCYKFIHSVDSYRPVSLIEGPKDSVTIRVYEKNSRLIGIHNFNGNDTVPCGGLNGLKIVIHTKEKNTYLKLNCRTTRPKHFKRFNDLIYFVHYDKIGRLTPGKEPVFFSFNSFILNYTVDKNNHLWVACYNDGLFELDESGRVINHYFEKTTINCVLFDSQNGLWASSTGSGLFHCASLNDKYFDKTDPLGKPINFIKRIDSSLFISNSLGDIYTVRNKRISKFKGHDKSNELLDMVKLKSRYLLSFRYCFLEYESESKHRELKSNNLLFSIHKIIPINNDSVLLIQRKRICLFFKDSVSLHKELNTRIYSAELRNKNLLIACEDGVWKFTQDRLLRQPFLKALENVTIKSIVVDSLKNYWFCSFGNGLFKLDSSNYLVNYNSSDGVPTNVINNVSFFKDKVLLSTNNGLYFSILNRGVFDHLKWKKIYSGAVENALIFENSIYLATKVGLVILDSKKIQDNGRLNFNLSMLKVNGIEKDLHKIANLKHNENNLEFYFDLISFDGRSYDINYNLKGPFGDSGIVNGNNINFQKLSPGHYTLNVEPKTSIGAESKLEIHFQIIPAFWQTKAFFILIFVTALVFIFSLVWLILRYIRKKETKKTNAERLILEYKLIALKAQINPHFMSNCLTAIQHLIINNKVDEATDYLAKFGLLVRQILNFSTRSLITLKEELEITELNIELEQLRFENKFYYELKVSNEINAKGMFVPALILNPIIENAIWHGLLPLKNTKRGKLLVEVKIVDSKLLIIIEDNGVGRRQREGDFGNTRESKGLELTEQRLNNINYLFNIDSSSIWFDDLIDQDNRSIGTRVTISLPQNINPLRNE